MAVHRYRISLSADFLPAVLEDIQADVPDKGLKDLRAPGTLGKGLSGLRARDTLDRALKDHQDLVIQVHKDLVDIQVLENPDKGHQDLPPKMAEVIHRLKEHLDVLPVVGIRQEELIKTDIRGTDLLFHFQVENRIDLAAEGAALKVLVVDLAVGHPLEAILLLDKHLKDQEADIRVEVTHLEDLPEAVKGLLADRLLKDREADIQVEGTHLEDLPEVVRGLAGRHLKGREADIQVVDTRAVVRAQVVL